MSYFQLNDKCNGCLACVENCPANALKSEDQGEKRTIFHNMARCARCGNCRRACPREAIDFFRVLENQWDEVRTLDLIRCEICGDPILTGEFRETLVEIFDKKPDPLCPRHREEVALLGWAHFFPNRKKPGNKT